MKSILLTTTIVIFTILFSCNSDTKVEQDRWAGSGEGAIDMAPAMETEIKFTPPEIKSEGTYNYSVVSNEEKTGTYNSYNWQTANRNHKILTNKKKIIKDGNISVKAKDINTSKKSIDALLKNLHAYYETEELQNDDQTISYNLKIRIPADNFEKLITNIENGSDEITSKSINARDITEEYEDIETRLSNKHEYLKRYKQLLSKANTVKDILAIEENIRVLQEEIESKEGRLKYLNDQVTFSSLDLNIYQEKAFIYKPQEQDKFSERVKKSLGNGWTAVIDFVLWVIRSWPYFIVILVLLIVYRRFKKKRDHSIPN